MKSSQPRRTSSPVIFDRDAELLILAEHRRDGARQVLTSLLDGLIWFQVGFVLTSTIGCLRSLCKMQHKFDLWVVFVPLWIGHIITSTSHISSFEKLRRFLFIPPMAIAQSRGALLMARREKIPFVIMWIRFTGQIFVAFVCIVFSELLLFLHFHQLETKSAEVIPMGDALFPLSLLAALNVIHGILCRGSPLRFFTSLVGFIQLQLISCRMDHHPILGISSWSIILSPSLVLAFTLFVVLIRYLAVFHLQEFGYSNNRRYRLIDRHQALVAWCYLGGMFFFGGFLCLLLEHLERPVLSIGISATLCLLTAQFLVLKGVHLAASQSVKVLEDYVGDHKPLPLYQDPETGEWVVRSELSIDLNNEDRPPFPCCISLLSCCSASPCFNGGGSSSNSGGGGGSGGGGLVDEDAPVLGARQADEEDGASPQQRRSLNYSSLLENSNCSS